MSKLPFYSFFMFLYFLVALFSGCSQQNAVVVKDRDSEPVVVVHFLGMKCQTIGKETTYCWSLEKFPVCEEHYGVQYLCVGCEEQNIAVALLWKQDEPESPGSLLLRFRVVHNTEVFDLPVISWNQRDNLMLIHGGTWMVKLAQNCISEAER